MRQASRLEKPAFRPGGRRGIYLISTLLLLTFLVMLGGAIAVSFQQGLASSGNFNNRQMALNAAMSGLQYVQARLESNPSRYGPGYTAPASADVVLSAELKVREKQDSATRAVNICGYLDNASVEGGGESRVSLMFRASFNGSYTAFAAQPSDWSFVNFGGLSWNTALGAMPQVSMNNLLRSSQLGSGSSYTTTGATFHQVPGGTVDIVVEGLVVRSDGLVVARRSVECVMGLTGSQSSTSSGAATSARDMNISLYQGEAAGGNLTVGVAEGVNAAFAENAGIAAYNGNINLNGRDAATSQTAPPSYTSTSRASVLSDKAFNYAWGSGSQSYSPGTAGQTVVQAQQVSPPTVKVSDLPEQSSPLALAAGTWVVWNGQIKHYPVDYNASVALADQTWAGGTSSVPPTLNGVAPDSATLPAGLTFDVDSNSINVASDVLVSASGGANGFAYVVAPSGNQPTAGGVNSASIGSAQLLFDASSGLTPQMRSPGSVAIIGNVTGQGALVATGTAGSNGAGDITVIGKSSLDPRSDAGVALYAAGSVDMKQLSFGQAPATVPAVRDTLGSIGVVEGTGASVDVSTTNLTQMQPAFYTAISQAMNAKYSELEHFLRYDGGTHNYRLTVPADKQHEFGDKIKDQNVTVTYNGHTYSGQLKNVLKEIAPQGSTLQSLFTSDPASAIGGITMSGITSSLSGTITQSFVSQPGWSETSYIHDGHTRTAYLISQAAFGNYMTSGTNTSTLQNNTSAAGSGGTSGTSTGTGIGAASGGGTLITQAALNQSFSGLVYAGRDLTIRNGLGSLTINGMVAAYGGDPNTQSTPGQENGGSINLSGNSVALLYDPSTLGPYLYLFGGVKLQVNSLANF